MYKGTVRSGQYKQSQVSLTQKKLKRNFKSMIINGCI